MMIKTVFAFSANSGSEMVTIWNMVDVTLVTILALFLGIVLAQPRVDFSRRRGTSSVLRCGRLNLLLWFLVSISFLFG